MDLTSFIGGGGGGGGGGTTKVYSTSHKRACNSISRQQSLLAVLNRYRYIKTLDFKKENMS